MLRRQAERDASLWLWLADNPDVSAAEFYTLLWEACVLLCIEDAALKQRRRRKATP